MAPLFLEAPRQSISHRRGAHPEFAGKCFDSSVILKIQPACIQGTLEKLSRHQQLSRKRVGVDLERVDALRRNVVPQQHAKHLIDVNRLLNHFSMQLVMSEFVCSRESLTIGMVQLPPVMLSAPFKILLFVLVDGWNLVVGSLMKSFY